MKKDFQFKGYNKNTQKWYFGSLVTRFDLGLKKTSWIYFQENPYSLMVSIQVENDTVEPCTSEIKENETVVEHLVSSGLQFVANVYAIAFIILKIEYKIPYGWQWLFLPLYCVILYYIFLGLRAIIASFFE